LIVKPADRLAGSCGPSSFRGTRFSLRSFAALDLSVLAAHDVQARFLPGLAP